MKAIQKVNKKDIEDIIALTPMQEGMLFHYLKDPGSVYYCEQLSLEISGEVDQLLIEQAWNFVVETNDMLRAVFRWEKVEKPSQIILKEHKCKVIYYDLSAKDRCQKKKVLEEIKNKDRQETFDLQRVPFRVTLCKLDEKEFQMIISNHHILYDGWSNGIILKEFFNAYHEFDTGNGRRSLKQPRKPHFKEFIQWSQNQERDKQQHFWREYLAGLETTTGVPIKKKAVETKGEAVESCSIILKEDIQGELEFFAKNNQLTLAAVFYTAWGILLQKYCNSEDVVFGTTVSGRSARIKGIEDMVGLFINTLPLRVQSGPDVKIIDVLHGIENHLREREEFENTPLVEIRDYIALPGSGTLFDTMVAIENYPLDSRLIPERSLLSVQSYSISEITHYDLTVGIIPFNDIQITFSFRRELFEIETMENVSRHFKGILLSIIRTPGTVLSQLEIISTTEKNRVLYEFNDTAAEYPKENSLPGLFAQQAETTPDNIAAVAPAKMEIKNRSNRTYMTSITYHQLNEKSTRLAYTLSEKGVKPDTIVGIMMERSIEMIVGILGILKAGGAYLPIDPGYPQERINYMLEDSKANILVINSNKFSNSYVERGKKERYKEIEIVNIQVEKPPPSHLHLPPAPAAAVFTPTLTSTSACQVNPASLAYVIYTSGSTGKPKGVLVRHDGVTNAICWRKNEYRLEKNDNVLQLFSFAFDGFVTSFFTPVISGSCAVFLSEEESRDIFAVKKAVVSMGITHFISVPSIYRSLLELCSPGDLPTLRIITLAGEAVDPVLLEKSRELNPQLKVMIEYGPTENTVVTTIYRDAHPGTGVLIGKPVANIKIYILDRNGHLSPIGVSGEINILGIGIARGYLNKPALTFEKFCLLRPGNKNKVPGKDHEDHEYPMPSCPHALIPLPTGHSPLITYHSGDLARWLHDGNIEFLGRMDHQVKVRGFRIELGEIENWLKKHPGVKEAVVAAHKDSAGEVKLCAYVVGGVEADELPRYLSGVLPSYMVPAHFEKIEAIPLTSSGKVNRNALPSPTIKTRQEYTAPGNEFEKALVMTWAEILKLDKKKIGIDDSFFRLGGHSLKATILAAKIHKVFDVKIPLTEVFKRPTIRKLAQYIKGMVKDVYVSIAPQEKKEYYLLSSAQKRMYIEQHMQIESKIYNVAALIILEGETNYERLTDAFRQLIKRHESLRTSFVTLQEEAVQFIHENVSFTIEYVKSEEENSQKIAANFWRPIDLSKAPLLRVGLMKISEIKHILMVEMHHIIADGISNQILMRDFRRLYRGEDLLPLRIQYKDFSGWQTRLFKSETIKKQEEYWKVQFMDEIPALDLPTDYPRPPGPVSHQAQSVTFVVDKELTARVNEVLVETGATMFMFLLAVTNILLSKYSGQADIVVGCPVSGRIHNDLQNIIGMFVNMLAIRSLVEGSQTFKKFLEKVKENVLDSYENQDYQYDELVKTLGLQGNTTRNPLFDVVLHMFNLEIPREEKPDKQMVTFVPYEDENMIVIPFDFILNAFEKDEWIQLEIRYITTLYKKKRIQMMGKHFLEIIIKVLEDKNIILKNLLLSHRLAAVKTMTPLEEEGDFLFQV
jgi:amino acid adenylation domain-containing protein